MNDARKSDSGQVLVMSVFMITVMLLFMGVLIDGGNVLLQRRNLQGNADGASLAAAYELANNTGSAYSVAQSYVGTNNPADSATVDQINILNNNTKVTVQVSRQVPGTFLSLLNISAPTVRAQASAEVASLAPSATTGMLPMAFMRGSYTMGQNDVVKFDGNEIGNRGLIAPDNNPPICAKSTGASDTQNLIESADYGGFDSCAYKINDTVPTETGNKAGQARTGFDTRVPSSNTDSFTDLFKYDENTGHWAVTDMNNPRVGIVPVIENIDGTTIWPSGSSTNVRIVGYVLVYIGETSAAGFPPYTDNGKDVWVTPVSALLPADFAGVTSTSTGFADEPIAIHLVS